MDIFQILLLIFLLNFEAPVLILEQRAAYNTRRVKLHRLQKLPVLFILAAIIFPVALLGGVRYDAGFIVWILAYAYMTPVYWIVYALIALKGKWNTDVLRLISGIYCLIAGASMAYWAIIISSVILIIITIYCLESRKKEARNAETL